MQTKDSQEFTYHNVNTRNFNYSYPTPVDGVKPFCEDPRIIVNTKLPEFILVNEVVYSFNVDRVEVPFVVPSYIINQISVKVKKQQLLRFLRAFIRNNRISYFVSYTGEFIASTIYVECGHCAVCLERKRHHFTSLCEMEAQQHDTLPLFITLTYHDNFLPTEGLRKIDVQKYFKRVRRSLDKKHISHSLKYAYCGEYGKLGRPHYHILLYGFPMDSFTNYLKVEEFLKKKWNLGFVMIKPVTSITGVSKYIGKYMTKSLRVAPGDYEVLPFVKHSQNMGVSFVKRVASNVIDKGYQQVHYCDRFSGKLMNLPLTKYYINKLIPGVSQLSVDIRNSNLLRDIFNGEKNSLFGDYFFNSEVKPIVDMSYYKDNQIKRDNWFNGMFESLPEIDPAERAYNLRNAHERMIYKQKL